MRFVLLWGGAGFTIKSQVIWDLNAMAWGLKAAAFAPTHDVIWFGVKKGVDLSFLESSLNQLCVVLACRS